MTVTDRHPPVRAARHLRAADRRSPWSAIAAGAPARDEVPQPAFPADAFAALADAGLLGWTRGRRARRARRRRASSRSCARWPRPTARSGGSTTGISTRSNVSPSRARRSCASASCRASSPASCSAGSGAVTRGRARVSRRRSSTRRAARSCAGSRRSAREPAACTGRSCWPAAPRGGRRCRRGSISPIPSASASTPPGIAPTACGPRSRTASCSRDLPVLELLGAAGLDLGPAVVRA